MAGMNGSRKDTLNTIVGEGSVLEGNIQVRENIRVDGSLVGRLTTSGTLEVSPSGVVVAAGRIKAKAAVIAGRLEGNLEADQVKLESSAVLVGDIKAKLLVIEEGAAMSGFLGDSDPSIETDRKVERTLQE